MTERAFVFGVDLDGVVADFYAGLRPVAAEWVGGGLAAPPGRGFWGVGGGGRARDAAGAGFLGTCRMGRRPGAGRLRGAAQVCRDAARAVLEVAADGRRAADAP